MRVQTIAAPRPPKTHQAAKNQNVAARRVQSSDKKHWPTKNVHRKFNAVLIAVAAARISSGAISEGPSHASGPPDHAKPAT